MKFRIPFFNVEVHFYKSWEEVAKAMPPKYEVRERNYGTIFIGNVVST